MTNPATTCAHAERDNGICVRCGHCEHDVILNGACLYCGTTDIDPIAISPKKPPALIPATRLTKPK
ncbi:MAG: hypothetical protein AB7P03_05310 [Kofleriaceae bacterium]